MTVLALKPRLKLTRPTLDYSIWWLSTSSTIVQPWLIQVGRVHLESDARDAVTDQTKHLFFLDVRNEENFFAWLAEGRQPQ